MLSSAFSAYFYLSGMTSLCLGCSAFLLIAVSLGLLISCTWNNCWGSSELHSHNLLFESPSWLRHSFLSGLQFHLSGWCLGSPVSVVFEYCFHDEWRTAAFTTWGEVKYVVVNLAREKYFFAMICKMTVTFSFILSVWLPRILVIYLFLQLSTVIFLSQVHAISAVGHHGDVEHFWPGSVVSLSLNHISMPSILYFLCIISFWRAQCVTI